MVANNKHWHLYVLKLQEDKYYVGITSNSVEYRYKQHVNGFAGASWTKKHKPISILDTRDLGYVSKEEAEYYENVVVRKYIHKYGINNVRGGDISQTGNFFIFRHTVYDKDYLTETLKAIIVGAIFAFAIMYLIKSL